MTASMFAVMALGGKLLLAVAFADTAGTGSDSGGAGTTLTQFASELFFWIQSEQQWFSQHMTGAIEQLAGGNAWTAGLLLASFSFIYGVFHAVGPGHGKAVISSYVLANERTLRRGVLISFMAGFFQAVSAVAIVSVMGLLFKLGSRRMDLFSNNLETISYAAIALFGLWLLFTQVRSYFLPSYALAVAGHDHGQAHDHDHGHDHGHDHHGHAHLPEATELDGQWSWTKATSMAALVGLRPCTGALIVLVVALHQGLYWAGVASTFVMALGTSITVSLLAVMAVASRDLATRLAGTSELWVGRVEAFAKIGGGLAMVLVGLAFFLASLHPHPLQLGGS